MAGNFSNPATSQQYADTFSATRDNLSDLAKQLDATSTLNPPVGAKRWNATNRYWEVCSNSSGTGTWGKMVDDTSTRYEIRVWKADQLNSAQNFSITGDASAPTVSFDGTGAVQLNLTISSLAATKGGTGQTSYVTGNIIYASATNTLAKLAPGTGFLKMSGSVPSWATLADGDIPTTLSSKTLGNTNTVTLKDNQFTLQDQTDTSKQMQFDLAGLTTATTRTITLPDLTGTMMLTAGAQTVTGKTFGAGNTWQGNTIAVGYGGTGETSWSTGGLAYYNGTKLTGAVLNGLVKANAASAPTAATAAEIVSAIGSTAVTNATNATNLTGSGTISDTTTVAASGVKVGYRNVPGNTQSTSYQIALTDVGKSIDTTAGVTVPPNSTVAFAVGDTISITNTSGSTITITQGSGVTLRQAGTANTGNRSLAQYGVCTVRKTATDTWTIAGAGIS